MGNTGSRTGSVPGREGDFQGYADAAHLFILGGDNHFPFIAAAVGADSVGDGWSLAVGANGMCRGR